MPAKTVKVTKSQSVIFEYTSSSQEFFVSYPSAPLPQTNPKPTFCQITICDENLNAPNTLYSHY